MAMAWLQICLDTTRDAVDWVRSFLAGAGYVEELAVTSYEAAEPQALWTFTICFYIPNDRQSRARVERLEQLLSPLQRAQLAGELRVEALERKPAPEQAAGLAGLRIGQRFVLLPAGAPEPPPQAGALPLRLGPTLAFGSGLHPATALCLGLIERHARPEMRALDLGCGTGILSIALARLGASVLALDNDQLAVQSTREALALNGLERQVGVARGSLARGSQLGHWMGELLLEEVASIAADGSFDLVVANILARVHSALAADYRAALRPEPGGMLITSGFTADQQEEVELALQDEGFVLVEAARCEDWVALAHRLAPGGAR